jgi:hypothetical protein
MPSFIRTIPREEEPEHIEEILSRTDHFIPLKLRPRRANPGDSIYLAYRGEIVGRAVINRFESAPQDVSVGSGKRVFQAKCLVYYGGGWQRPSQSTPFRGYQGIRYLDKMGLEYLDSKAW